LRSAHAPANPTRSTRVYLEGAWRDVPLYQREALLAGHSIEGPAVIAEYSATTWVPSECRAEIVRSGDLLLVPGR